jgi:hypothetical protein
MSKFGRMMSTMFNSNYVMNGLIFWADGYDATVGGKWVDRISGKEGTLSANNTHDAVNKRYSASAATDNFIPFTVPQLGRAGTIDLYIIYEGGTDYKRIIAEDVFPSLYLDSGAHLSYLCFSADGCGVCKEKRVIQMGF